MRLPTCAALILTGQALSTSTALGVVVAPGDQLIFLGTTDLTAQSFGGSTILDKVIAPISGTPSFSFPDAHALVIKRADTGTLDYYFAVGSGTEPNSSFVVDGFAGSALDIYQFQAQGSLQVLPTSAFRSSGNGSDVTISTPLGSLAGYFVFRSSDVSLPASQTLTYVEGDDTGGPDRTARYQIESTAPVPEPQSLFLIPLAMTALLGHRRMVNRI